MTERPEVAHARERERERDAHKMDINFYIYSTLLKKYK